MEEHQKRVVEERRELNAKLVALLAFIETEKFLEVDPAEQLRLKRQLVAMDSYSTILAERIDAFTAEPYMVGSFKMQRVRADSSHIEAVGSDGIDMRVEYKGGRAYTFRDIPPAKVEEIRVSESPGREIIALGVKGTAWEPPKERE